MEAGGVGLGMIKRIKDRTNLIAEWKLKSTHSKHYYHVYLWKDQASLKKNTVGNEDHDLLGCAQYNSYIVLPETGQVIPQIKLGEIHFIKGEWNIEIVTHEIMHAYLHKLRVFPEMRYQAISQEGNAEEKICSEFGQWVEDVYLALWKKNPCRKWKKTIK